MQICNKPRQQNLPTQTSPAPDRFPVEFYPTFEKPNTTFNKLVPEAESEGILPESFYKASITLLPKPYKDKIIQ